MTDAVRTSTECMPASQDVDVVSLEHWHRYQSSPTGRAVATVVALVREVDEIDRLAAMPGGWNVLRSESRDLEYARSHVSRLLRRMEGVW
jgi:hypothetical protein